MEGLILFIVIIVISSLAKNVGQKASAQQNRQPGEQSAAYERAQQAAAQRAAHNRASTAGQRPAAPRPTGARPTGARPTGGQSAPRRPDAEQPDYRRTAAQRANPAYAAAGKRSYQDDVRGKGAYGKRPRTQRERWEESSTYEHSNYMDVRYTARGCGCYGEGDSTSAGRKHGFRSATYDEQKFYQESRAICSGNWS